MWLLPLCLALTLAGTGIQMEARIVWGEECAKNSRPWQAALFAYDTFMCGGVLVHPQWVLTAAHCHAGNYEVRLGCHQLDGCVSSQHARVSKDFVHPLFNRTLLEALDSGAELSYWQADFSQDIMLLRLEQPVQLTAAVQVLDLPSQEPKEGSVCYASGWGSINSFSYQIPNTLQCVNLKLQPNQLCDSYGFKNTDAMLCAGELKGGQDTCQSDSGGPLTCDGVLQGLTSVGRSPCGFYGPSFYVKVFSFVDWIKETMEANT